MRVLFVGSDEVWALEQAYLNEFSKHCEVDLFNAHGTFLEYYGKGIINKILYKIGLSGILKKLNALLIDRAERFQPDVIWIFKGMEIHPDTIIKLKENGSMLVNYNPDHPFEFFSRGSGNTNITNSIGLYNMHFSYSLGIKKRIEDTFNIPCHWLPFGYYNAVEPTNTIKEINKVCFIGNGDKDRIRIIKLLAENNISIDVYGQFWQELIGMNNISLNKSIYKEDFNKISQQYRIQLNVFRPHNAGSHNMRTFEMPALGCIMLAPESEEHQKFFKEGEEAFFFDSDEALILKCQEILSMDESKAFQIKKNAYKRSIGSAYSYSDRAKFAYHKIEELVNA